MLQIVELRRDRSEGVRDVLASGFELSSQDVRIDRLAHAKGDGKDEAEHQGRLQGTVQCEALGSLSKTIFARSLGVIDTALLTTGLRVAKARCGHPTPDSVTLVQNLSCHGWVGHAQLLLIKE